MSFTKHNPKINAYAQKSPKNMQDMVMMVALSIQQPWHSIGTQMRDYRKLGMDSRFVWGNKGKTLQFLIENRDEIYREAMDALSLRGKERDYALMQAFLKIDGMGLAKAGFCCQLFAGCVGCIDVHNLRRLDIPESVLSFSKKAKPETQAKKVQAYVDACYKRRCSWLWNSWCNLIAKKEPTRWVDGDHVSAVHFEYLVTL